MIRWIEESQERPDWPEVAPLSTPTKVIWQDWDAFRLVDGILERKWVRPDGQVLFWQAIAPKKWRP